MNGSVAKMNTPPPKGYSWRIRMGARYSRFLAKCVHDRPADVEICKKFLSAAAYNKKVQSGERVTQYEIQVWTWDFRSYPFDPNYGNLTGRFIFEINTGRALREMSVEGFSRPDSAPAWVPDPVKDAAGAAR